MLAAPDASFARAAARIVRHLPSRYRRLDGALADLPLEEPMLLTELDGFLTGLLVCPDDIPTSEWIEVVWGADDDGPAPFEDPLDVQWFADAVMARRREIARDLTRGKLQPIFDVDERSGDVLWEAWLDGFADAMALRPDAWEALAEGEDPVAADALARLSILLSVANEESDLDSVEINTLQDRARGEITECVGRLYAARPRQADTVLPDAQPSAKIGRNDPCRCGSGNKFKRCCG